VPYPQLLKGRVVLKLVLAEHHAHLNKVLLVGWLETGLMVDGSNKRKEQNDACGKQGGKQYQ
jgi:hypothetical protein